MPNEVRSDTCPPAKVPTVLLVDDDKALLRLLTLHLKSAGYAVEAVTSGEEALAKLHVFRPLLVITDLWMDGMDGMTLFDRIHATNPWLPVMVLTAHGTIAHAVEATQRGAFSYLTKPFDSDELTALVERAMSLYADSDVIIQPELSEGAWSEGIITRNEQMRTLLAQAHRAALFDVSVLIQGESGTGKELLARAIHRASKRAEHPFIALNCGAVPEELLESELFGHAKGAFTGATRDHKGLFQAAYGGTLFLDEIGDMPLTFQTKLLRVIQEEEVRPVGATQSIATDVRIVAATHRNLAEEVAQKRFREDLFYRLNVMPLEILPLRERREDIPLLANHFLEQFLSGQSRDAQRQLSPAAMEVLAAQAWSGNVRQLRNVVERSVVLSSAPVVSADQVSDALQGDEDALPSLADARRDSERRYLVQVLEIAGGNVTRAAQLAQRNRTEFYKLLNRHDIDPHRFRAAEAD
ncbi:MAG: sigma-54 dependent transcriptional regulator [Sinobacteraceae bacterium]|nr:sigma-54 dependent transcriptional regulator [Nevskiaceae bacterium]